MTDTVIRIFEPPNVRLFELSPLYADPGWYGTADAAGTSGPFRSRKDLLQVLDTLTPGRPTELHLAGAE